MINNAFVVLVDNNSDDDDWQRIVDWVKSHYVFSCKHDEEKSCGQINSDKISFVRLKKNAGWAVANNVGMRLAISMGADYLWLLNNDVIVDKMCLLELLKFMVDHPDTGICGCVVCEYVDRNKIQAVGGLYNRWTGLTSHILAGQDINQVVEYSKVKKQLAYINGASMFVRRQFFFDVGKIEEKYFLYFEELDWALRGRDLYDIDIALKAIVYHKGGATVAKFNSVKGKTTNAFYFNRNRLLVSRKFFPKHFVFVACWMLYIVVKWKIIDRDKDEIKNILLALKEVFWTRNKR